MPKLAKIFLMAVCFSALAIALGFLTSSPAPASATGAPVNITAVSVPSVPVSGNVNANITGTANVNVSNTPNVSVTNTPTVSLTAGSSVNASNPLDAQGNPTPLATVDASQPYHDHCGLLSFGGVDNGGCSFHLVPAGKRLVIQAFDVRTIVDTGLKPVEISVLNVPPSHYFTATFMGTFEGLDYFATHQETRLYIDPNLTPTCHVLLTGASSNGSLDCQLSGFLVDVPVP